MASKANFTSISIHADVRERFAEAKPSSMSWTEFMEEVAENLSDTGIGGDTAARNS